MSQPAYEIDYDSEAVFFEDAWRTRADLAKLIRERIDKGDYRVAKPSAALEALEAGLASGRILAARVSPELAAAVEEMAARERKAVAAVLREALQAAVRRPEREAATPPPAAAAPSLADLPTPGPANSARLKFERTQGAPPLAQVAERLAEAVLAETEGAAQGGPRDDETRFGR
ncbi:MAG TPA: hypothetical protein VN033_03775 [Vulgatibacter sp.]|nr:hypothetical protein [Vulgatibacter sp.]